jgi:hypothetical protein
MVPFIPEPGGNRLQIRRKTYDDALPDLPEFAPDWGNEPDEDLSLSETVGQRTKVIRSRDVIDWDRKTDLFAKHMFRCLYCGVRPPELVVDHIVPVKQGGSSAEANLAPACRPCNAQKKAKELAAWIVEAGLDPEEILGRWRDAGRTGELRVVA